MYLSSIQYFCEMYLTYQALRVFFSTNIFGYSYVLKVYIRHTLICICAKFVNYAATDILYFICAGSIIIYELYIIYAAADWLTCPLAVAKQSNTKVLMIFYCCDFHSALQREFRHEIRVLVSKWSKKFEPSKQCTLWNNKQSAV